MPSEKLELEYSQSLSAREAFSHLSALMNGLQEGAIQLSSEEPIRLEVPGRVALDFRLKDKPKKGGRLEIRLEWEESRRPESQQASGREASLVG